MAWNVMARAVINLRPMRLAHARSTSNLPQVMRITWVRDQNAGGAIIRWNNVRR